MRAYDPKIDSGEYEVIRRLTDSEIKALDEISASYKAAEQTLRIALNYHTNRQNRSEDDLTEWWERVTGLNRYDDEFQGLRVSRHEGHVVIVRDKPDAE